MTEQIIALSFVWGEGFASYALADYLRRTDVISWPFAILLGCATSNVLASNLHKAIKFAPAALSAIFNLNVHSPQPPDDVSTTNESIDPPKNKESAIPDIQEVGHFLGRRRKLKYSFINDDQTDEVPAASGIGKGYGSIYVTKSDKIPTDTVYKKFESAQKTNSTHPYAALNNPSLAGLYSKEQPTEYQVPPHIMMFLSSIDKSCKKNICSDIAMKIIEKDIVDKLAPEDALHVLSLIGWR
jgi:hypothetical protein